MAAKTKQPTVLEGKHLSHRTDISPGGMFKSCAHKEYNHTMASAQLDMMKSKELTDFKIQLSNGKAIDCHKMILVISCPFFEKMLEDSDKNEIDLKELDPEALNTIIEYLYCGELEMKSNLLQSLYEAAVFLELVQLKADCSQRLLATLKEENADDLYEFGCRHDLKAIKELCEIKYFKAIAKSTFFKSLPFDKILAIVKKDDIEVETEDDVLDACLNWALFNNNYSEKDFQELLSNIRLFYCSPKFLDAIIEKHGEIIPLEWKTKDDREKAAARFELNPRVKQNVGKVYLMTGISEDNEGVSYFLDEDNRWRKYRDGDFCPYRLHPVMHGFIEVSESKVIMNDTLRHSSYELCDLKNPVRGFEFHPVSIVVGNDLYVFGADKKGLVCKSGCLNLNDVNEFRSLAKMKYGIVPMGASVAFYNGRIYILGRMEYGYNYSTDKCFQSYDIASNTWKSLATPKLRTGLCSIYPKNGTLFCVRNSSLQLWSYNIANNNWTNHSSKAHCDYESCAKCISHVKINEDNIVFLLKLYFEPGIHKKRVFNMNTCKWSKSKWVVPKKFAACANFMEVDMSMSGLNAWKIVVDDEGKYREACTPGEWSADEVGGSDDSERAYWMNFGH